VIESRPVSVPSETESNAAERRRWNDDYWASAWPKREQLTDPVTDVLLERAGLNAGDRVLDIGSGGGRLALAAARYVGRDGVVVGADISRPLVALAERRAGDAGATNVTFVVADVQHDAIPGAPFDAAISQFGVMFFDEPATAFANVRRQLVPEGRLIFACWQPVETNPWFAGPALAAYIPAPAPPAPGKSPSGPFSLSDPRRVGEILALAGWKNVERIPCEIVVSVERTAIIDDDQLTFMGVPEESLEQARRAVDEQLERLTGSDGRVQAPLSFQIFVATA
jgi:SAM-dependent methyltransferase